MQNKYGIPPMPKTKSGKIDLDEYRTQLWNTVHLMLPDAEKGAKAYNLGRFTVVGCLVLGVVMGILHIDTTFGEVLTASSTIFGLILKLRGAI